MKEKELDNLTYLKTIMTILVVLYHSCLFFKNNWFTYVEPVYSANYIIYFASWLATFQTRTFTMISGFLYYYLKNIKGKYNDPKKDIKKRFKRLIIPLFCASIFWAIPFNIIFFKPNLWSIIKNYLLMYQPSQLWFLPMLFIIFCLFIFWGKKLKYTKKELIIVSSCSITLGFILYSLHINYFQISRSILYISYYYLGCYLAKRRIENNLQFNLKKSIIILLSCIIVYIIFQFIQNYNIKLINVTIDYIMNFISLLEVYAIYVLSNIFFNSLKIKKRKVCSALETNGMGIYIFHQQLIFLTILLLNGRVHPIIQVLLSWIICLSISTIISMILKKNKRIKFALGL